MFAQESKEKKGEIEMEDFFFFRLLRDTADILGLFFFLGINPVCH